MSALRYTLAFLGAFVGCIGVYVGLFVVGLAQPVWPYQWLRNVYLVKDAIARDAPAPKWLLLGGSSVWFGYDSAVLAAAAHGDVVNLGSHAELPLEFLFWQAERHATRGDTILLSPELTYLLGPRTLTTYAATEIELMAPEYFWSGDVLAQWELLKAVPPARIVGGLLVAARGTRGVSAEKLWTSPKEVMDNLRRVWAGTYAGLIPAYYNYLEVSQRGDMARVRAAADHPHSDYGLAPVYVANERAWQTLRTFAQRMKRRGVRCMLGWQPFELHTGIDYNSPRVAGIFKDIEERAAGAGWTVLGRPADGMFSGEFFYDTPYHLTTDGARLRSERLIQRMAELPGR